MKKTWLTSRRTAALLGLILVLGLAVRMAIILQFSMGPNFYSDENGYLTGGITFANTGYISYTDADGRTSATCVGMQMTLGALFSLLGYTPNGQIAAHILWSSISLMTAFIAYLFAKRWSGCLTGLVAAAFCAVEPGLVTASCLFTTETPFICLSLSAMYLLAQWVEEDSFPCFWGGVLCVIGAALFRGVALMTLIVPIVLLIRKRPPLRPLLAKIAVAVLAFVLVFTPWWVRNAKMSNRFVIFTTNSGDIQLLGSYIGFGAPEGTYEEMVVELDAEAWAHGFQNDGVRRFERRGEVGKERLGQWFRENPVGFVMTHLFYKPWLLITGHNMSFQILPEKVTDAAWWLCLLLAVWGLITARRGLGKPPSFYALAVYLLIGCVTSAMFAPLDRYGLPYFPLWLMYAACGFTDLCSRLCRRITVER